MRRSIRETKKTQQITFNASPSVKEDGAIYNVVGTYLVYDFTTVTVHTI